MSWVSEHKAGKQTTTLLQIFLLIKLNGIFTLILLLHAVYIRLYSESENGNYNFTLSEASVVQFFSVRLLTVWLTRRASVRPVNVVIGLLFAFTPTYSDAGLFCSFGLLAAARNKGQSMVSR